MFNQKMLLSVLLFSYVSIAIAKDDRVICPTVDEIKREAFHSWLPLYKDGEELASARDVEKFKKNVVNFQIARWSADYLESAHCFYQGTDPIIDKIVFAQDAWQPETSPNWIWRNPKYFAECLSSNLQNCVFLK